ncbi:hypothetical protein BDZ85DRAFT_254807 [Elsinoe ampelina]|uniref:Uncharacterized protein n=1 Tax=Elsinoe ampelina TaxID=302913 RepID=A0A6A6GQ58_9PEZI|nr:hypothetical protein BDZ85DRAFT_254807 [Elsinoe ampelina]
MMRMKLQLSLLYSSCESFTCLSCQAPGKDRRWTRRTMVKHTSEHIVRQNFDTDTIGIGPVRMSEPLNGSGLCADG